MENNNNINDNEFNKEENKEDENFNFDDNNNNEDEFTRLISEDKTIEIFPNNNNNIIDNNDKENIKYEEEEDNNNLNNEINFPINENNKNEEDENDDENSEDENKKENNNINNNNNENNNIITTSKEKEEKLIQQQNENNKINEENKKSKKKLIIKAGKNIINMDGIKNNIVTPLSQLNLKTSNDEIKDTPEINKKKEIIIKKFQKRNIQNLIIKNIIKSKKNLLFPTNINKNIYFNKNKTIETDLNFELKAFSPDENFIFNEYSLIHILKNDEIIILECNGIYNNNNENNNKNFTFDYCSSTKKITFFFTLHNQDSIKISLKYIINNNNKNRLISNFYQYFYISKKFQYSNLNFTLKFSNNFNVLTYRPIILHRMAKNNYFFFGIVPKNGILLLFSLTPKFVKYKVTYKETFNLLPNKNCYFFVPKYFCGGNIKNISYNIKSSMSEIVDDKYIKENRGNFILTFPPSSKENEEASFMITSELYVFSLIKSGDISKFNGPNIGINLDNFKYTNFTKQIIEQDKKEMPDYIKIGKWIKKNIIYDIKYLNKKMTIDEILNIKKGVCVHFTKLFNALLNSINIPSEHIWGWVIEKNKKTAHAWSIFLYENEWKFADCTMGYFRGVIPCSHIMWNRAICGRRSSAGVKSKVERNIELLDNED